MYLTKLEMAIVTLLVLAAWSIGFINGRSYSYGDESTLNQGYIIIMGSTSTNQDALICGYETRGEIGFFCNPE